MFFSDSCNSGKSKNHLKHHFGSGSRLNFHNLIKEFKLGVCNSV